MAAVFYFPLVGTPTAEGNQLFFYEAGLDVPLDVFTDSDLTLPWAQPIVLNAAGESDGPIYVTPDVSQKVVYLDANDVPIPGYPIDFVSPSTIINVTTVATVQLTNAQIKALPTTPITLVSAPATGLRVKVFNATLLTNTSAGAYTNLNTTYCALTLEVLTDVWATVGLLNDNTTSPALTMVTDFLGIANTYMVDLPAPYAAVPVTTTQGWVVPQIPVGKTAWNGAALTLQMDNNGSGALTGGNAANSLTVNVYYCLESVA